jgi:integrase
VVCPHGLRGTHATLAEDAGAVGFLVAQQMGHENHRITEQHYIASGTSERVRSRKTIQLLAGEEKSRGNF